MTALSVYRGWIRVRNWAFSRLCRRSFASFGAKSVIQLPVRVHGEKRIFIGSGVFIGPRSWLQMLSHDRGELVIGDLTSIMGSCTLSAVESIRIGRRVGVGSNVYIADHRHGFADPNTPILDQDLCNIRPVEVGDGAWLGNNVFVGPGVRIGKGAVVGANSVVLQDVPDRSVAVGVPARVIQTLSVSDTNRAV